METDAGREQQQLHSLVDLLAPVQVHALRALVEAMLDPVARAIAHARLWTMSR